MCVRPSSPSGSNSAAAAVDDNSSDKADSSPPALTNFSNLVEALHNAVDAIRAQNGLPPVVSEAARMGSRCFDVCRGCRGKPAAMPDESAVVCPNCGHSVTASWVPW